MRIALRSCRLFLVLALPAALAGCDESTRTITELARDTLIQTVTIRDTVRFGNTRIAFDQIEHLANPLVSEVLVEKREHEHYNNTVPSEMRAEFRDDVVGFITGVAGRSPATAGAIADALLPDMLLVFLDRAPGVTAATANDPANATLGWLTYILVPGVGYGGRRLRGDDTVDKGLLVVFGPVLDPANVTPQLSTDNVPANDKTPTATFPYIADPF
jgi:hypothetical protein